MFLKPANSDMENGLKSILKCPLKCGTGNWKRHLKNSIFKQLFISKRPASLKNKITPPL